MGIKKCAVAALILSLLVAGWWVSRNRVVVTNESGQTIHSLTVDICGKSIWFGDLPPGESVSAHFGTPDDEDSFVVRGLLEDQTWFEEHCGYVVWEDYGRRFQIVLHPGGEVTEERPR